MGNFYAISNYIYSAEIQFSAPLPEMICTPLLLLWFALAVAVSGWLADWPYIENGTHDFVSYERTHTRTHKPK